MARRKFLRGARGAAPSIADLVAPRRFAWSIIVAEPDAITIECSEAMFPVSTALSAFTLGGTMVTAKTFTSIDYDGIFIYLRCSSNFVPGDAPTIAYTQPGSNKLQDYGGNFLPSWTALPVANQFDPPATSAVRKTGQTLFAEGGGGIVQSGAGGTTQMCQVTLSTILATHNSVLVDTGWIEFQASDSTISTRAVGMQTGVGTTLNEMTFSARFASSAARAYVLGVAQGSAYTFASPSVDCRVRLYRAMPEGLVTMDTSEDGGISWTVRYTFAAANEVIAGLYARAYTSSTVNALIGCALQSYSDQGF